MLSCLVIEERLFVWQFWREKESENTGAATNNIIASFSYNNRGQSVTRNFDKDSVINRQK